MTIDPAQQPEPVNQVVLRGRLGAEPITRELPSGDELVVFRVTVARPAPRRTSPAARSRVTVDSIDCQGATAAVRRALRQFATGDGIEVRGRLQRRFWRGPAGLGSRYEVEVDQVRRWEPES